MTTASTTASPIRRRQKPVPLGEPFSELSLSQQKAVLNLRKLRREMADEIERMIAFLDSIDGYSNTEIEEDQADPSEGLIRSHAQAPAGSLEDDEPSLGFQAADPFVGSGCENGGSGDDREVEDEHDEEGWDREGDELEHGGDEHDGREPDADGEPSLGWTCAASEGNGGWGGDSDREADGSYVTEAARQRYKPFDRYAHNPDGKHVDTERGYGAAARRLRNLSDQQREVVTPRLNRDEVRI